jgi:hypothetical protein
MKNLRLLILAFIYSFDEIKFRIKRFSKKKNEFIRGILKTKLRKDDGSLVRCRKPKFLINKLSSFNQFRLVL